MKRSEFLKFFGLASVGLAVIPIEEEPETKEGTIGFYVKQYPADWQEYMSKHKAIFHESCNSHMNLLANLMTKSERNSEEHRVYTYLGIRMYYQRDESMPKFDTVENIAGKKYRSDYIRPW